MKRSYLYRATLLVSLPLVMASCGGKKPNPETAASDTTSKDTAAVVAHDAANVDIKVLDLYDPDLNQLPMNDPEEDKKVLCLMVDQSRINENSDDIPFIRSLFKISKYYEDRVMRKGELKFILEKNDTELEYFSIGF